MAAAPRDRGPVAHLAGGHLEVSYQPCPGVRKELAELAAAERTSCSLVTCSVWVVESHPVLRVRAPAEEAEAVARIAALFGATSTATDLQ